jgi:hypothetical protein
MSWEHDAHDTWTRGPFDVSIYLDLDAENPRTACDPMGKFIVTKNTRDHGGLSTASLSDYGIYEAYGSWYRETGAGEEIEVDEDDIPAMIEKLTGGIVHEVTLRGYSQGDWAEGLFVVTRDELAHEYGTDARGHLRKDAKKKARRYLAAQAEELNAYFAGDVFGYVIEHDGEHVDSCWGFYGADSVREAANEAANAMKDDPQYQASWEEPYSPLESAA